MIKLEIITYTHTNIGKALKVEVMLGECQQEQKEIVDHFAYSPLHVPFTRRRQGLAPL